MHIPDEIVGQGEAVRLLGREMASGKMSHAYLLWGPRGSGKMALARRLALAANCTPSAARGGASGGGLNLAKMLPSGTVGGNVQIARRSQRAFIQTSAWWRLREIR